MLGALIVVVGPVPSISSPRGRRGRQIGSRRLIFVSLAASGAAALSCTFLCHDKERLLCRSNVSWQYPFYCWSEWRDLNSRPSAPKADALARLSYTQVLVTELSTAFAVKQVTNALWADISTNCRAAVRLHKHRALGTLLPRRPPPIVRFRLGLLHIQKMGLHICTVKYRA